MVRGYTFVIPLAMVGVIVLAAVLIGFIPGGPGVWGTTSGDTQAPQAPANAGQEAEAWCRSDVASNPRFQVGQAGARWLGMAFYSEDDREAFETDPRWPIACRLAFELWGIPDPLWDWCYDEKNRDTLLAPAITLLGLGRQERAGTETFSEAPGDDPAEYTLACRLADRYWRDSGVVALAEEQTDKFLAVDPVDRAWCDERADDVNEAADSLGLHRSGLGDLPGRLAEVRACRFAAILALAEALPPTPTQPTPSPTVAPLAAGEFTAEILFLNRTDRDLEIRDVAVDADRSFVLPGCSAVRANRLARVAPWSLSVLMFQDPTELAYRTEGGGSQGDSVRLEVELGPGTDIEVREVEHVPDLPTEDLC
ncbi:MAG: hypothetical protein H0U86_01540 [Chloroflexi bacterium]|nr:hypothetical protein [Chloroflexota bacterium]